MTQTRIPQRQPILTAKAATGIGTAVQISSFKNVVLQLGTASSADLTVKVQLSLSNTCPDFSAAASATNSWDYLATYNLSDPSTLVTGATGYVATGTDIVRNIVINTDCGRWLNCVVTARAAGSVTVDALLFNNQ